MGEIVIVVIILAVAVGTAFACFLWCSWQKDRGLGAESEDPLQVLFGVVVLQDPARYKQKVAEDPEFKRQVVVALESLPKAVLAEEREAVDQLLGR